MDLTKSKDFFDPSSVTETIHIIGCGSVGSTLAETLTRLGLKNFTLYDFDTVEEHNIVNQMFVAKDVGARKVDATKRIMCDINPGLDKTVRVVPEGYIDDYLGGYVFIAVDNIEVRKSIVERNRMNQQIKAVFDFRTALTEAQHYAADWKDMRQIKNLLKTMNFTHEEAAEAAPRSACGVELGVAPTVRGICTLGVCNFINFVKTGSLKNMMVFNPFAADIIC